MALPPLPQRPAVAVPPERHRRSHSQLNDYLHCGWSFRLKRIKKVPERPSVWLPGGKAFHTATEQFDLATWEEKDLTAYADPEPWINVFDEAFEQGLDEFRENDPDESRWRTAGRKTKDKPHGEDVAWWRENGRIFTRKYVEWRVSTADTLRIAAVEGGPGIEVEIYTTFGDVPVIAYVDRLLEDVQTGSLLLTDLKSGSRTPATPLQLAQYSIQLEPKVGRPIVWGAFYDARKGVLGEPISLTDFTKQNLDTIYTTLDKGIEQGIFLPNIGTHCVACGVKEACIWRGGTEPITEVM